jgi:hypothetical protein
MFSKRLLQLSMIVFCLAGWGRVAGAQGNLHDPKPVSNVGGPTGEALRQVYRNSLGQGYTASSLNMISLQAAANRIPYAGQSGTRSSPVPGGLGLGPANVSKPFSSVTPEPTVTPYLNLFREDRSGNSDLDYTTLVRPQLQQQQINQQAQRQSLDLERRLQSLTAQADFNAGGDKEQFPTGHKTAYRYYGHFFQMPSGRARRSR